MYFQTRQTRHTLALTQHFYTTESKRIKRIFFIKRLKGKAEKNKRLNAPNKIRFGKQKLKIKTKKYTTTIKTN